MSFQFLKTEISGVIEIIPTKFQDERGFFFESYNKYDFFKNGIAVEFVQDNTSFSWKNVVRGMHFQFPPYEQGKLIRVLAGRILDVVVDIRRGSSTFGKWVSRELSSENNKMLWIPPGFAHGFFAIEDSIVHYKVTREYNREAEGGIIYNDPIINIRWPSTQPIASKKDLMWPGFKNFSSPFYCSER